MTSEKLSGRRKITPVPKDILPDQKSSKTEKPGKTKEMTEKSVRRKIAMFEVIGNTDLQKYNFSQEKAHKELSNFKIESIRRNFHHKPSLPIPIVQPPLEEKKFRKTSDSFLVQKRAILDQCLTVDEKSVSNEEIAKAFSSENAVDVHNDGVFLQVQNDENSVSQTTLTSSTGDIEQSAETHYSTEQKSKEEERKLEDIFEFDLTKLPPVIDDVSLEISEEKKRTPSEVTRHSISDRRSTQDGDCNISLMTNGSSSTDGTYISIAAQVGSQLFAENRNSDSSSGDYKYAVPPSIEPIYDRAVTDQESSSSSNSAVLRRPTIINVLQKQDERIRRPSSWHLGISESEQQQEKFVRRQRRHSLSISPTKNSILDQDKDATSQPNIPSTSSTNDSWSGSEFNNELNFSTTSESGRSQIYDADDDESDPYDRPHQYTSENPYDTPSPSRPRSETTNTITHLFEPNHIDEILEQNDVNSTEIVREMSPTQMVPKSPKRPSIPARKWLESDSSCADESSSEKATTLPTDNREPVCSNLMQEDEEFMRMFPSQQLQDKLNQRRKTYDRQFSYSHAKKGSRRTRKFSVTSMQRSFNGNEYLESEPKKIGKYKRMLFPFKRSASVTVLSKPIDDVCAHVDFGSSESFENMMIESCSTEKSSKGFGKKFMQLMKRSKKSGKSE